MAEISDPGRNLKADEVEREIRAQIEHAISMGIHPTHLDSHMGMLFARPISSPSMSKSPTNTNCHSSPLSPRTLPSNSLRCFPTKTSC